jgi:hypothetical protein
MGDYFLSVGTASSRPGPVHSVGTASSRPRPDPRPHEPGVRRTRRELGDGGLGWFGAERLAFRAWKS